MITPFFGWTLLEGAPVAGLAIVLLKSKTRKQIRTKFRREIENSEKSEVDFANHSEEHREIDLHDVVSVMRKDGQGMRRNERCKIFFPTPMNGR